MCQGAAVTGQQCDGTGEEVRKCSDQRCPGECRDNESPPPPPPPDVSEEIMISSGWMACLIM